MNKYFYKIVITSEKGSCCGFNYILAKNYEESQEKADNYKVALNVLLPENITAAILFLGVENYDETRI